MFSLIYVWINDWANNREAGDLRRQHGHYDVIVMPALSYSYIEQIVWETEKTLKTRLFTMATLLQAAWEESFAVGAN